MEFSLGYISTNNQLDINIFSTNQEKISKRLDLNELNTIKLDGLLINSEDCNLSEIYENNKYYPLQEAKRFNISTSDFRNLSLTDATKIYNSMVDTWSLNNNVSLLSNLVETTNHLVSLWPNDRSAFFEELWFLLKTNLGSDNINLIYNDIIRDKHSKNKLIKIKVSGNKNPESSSGSEVEDMLIENYKADFGDTFNITEYDINTNKLVITLMINKSPVLVMANQTDLTPIKTNLIKALVENINNLLER